MEDQVTSESLNDHSEKPSVVTDDAHPSCVSDAKS